MKTLFTEASRSSTAECQQSWFCKYASKSWPAACNTSPCW